MSTEFNQRDANQANLPDPKAYVKASLSTIKGFASSRVSTSGDDPEPLVQPSLVLWLPRLGIILTGLFLCYSSLIIFRLVYYQGRPHKNVHTRPNLTVGVFKNQNISFIDKVLQFCFPLIISVGELVPEGSSEGPSPDTLQRVRDQIRKVSVMTYKPVIESLGYTVTTVDLPNCSVLLHYPPASPTPPQTYTSLPPLIVWAHGGGLTIGDAEDSYLSDWMKLLSQHSLCQSGAASPMPVFASVDYRLAPESKFPAAINDVVDAVLHFHTLNYSEKEPRYSSIHLAGASAGAYLVLMSLERLAASSVPLASIFVHEPMMPLTGDHPSQFVNAYSRTCPPRWIDWCWKAFAGGAVSDVYCGMSSSRWWKEYEENTPSPPKLIVTLAKGDPMCGGAEALYEAIRAESKLDVLVFCARSSHACSVLDQEVHKKILEKLAEYIFPKPATEVTDVNEDSDDSFIGEIK